MQPDIAQQLLELNHQFYQTFADQFSATRQRLQPGVVRVAESIPKTDRLLDLGCGNGQLAAYLAEQGYTGHYIGIDTSFNLIEIAQQQMIPNTKFVQTDLTETNWMEQFSGNAFSTIVAFAVLHHIPSQNLRVQFLHRVHQLLSPDGLFIHSNWRFLNSPKLVARIQPWEKIGLTAEMVDENDYLLDWRRGGKGLRYVHYFTRAELQSLAEHTGFEVKDEFTSDGASGDLGLYQYWEKNKEIDYQAKG